jgi:hypothetical protein
MTELNPLLDGRVPVNVHQSIKLSRCRFPNRSGRRGDDKPKTENVRRNNDEISYLRGDCHLPGNDGDARQQQKNDQLQRKRGCGTERDGAFRDGLYLGGLAAESNQQPRPEVGGWSTDQDRATITAGYRRGDNEALARGEP